VTQKLDDQNNLKKRSEKKNQISLSYISCQYNFKIISQYHYIYSRDAQYLFSSLIERSFKKFSVKFLSRSMHKYLEKKKQTAKFLLL
jgi:hypothetical protein